MRPKLPIDTAVDPPPAMEEAPPATTDGAF